MIARTSGPARRHDGGQDPRRRLDPFGQVGRPRVGAERERLACGVVVGFRDARKNAGASTVSMV